MRKNYRFKLFTAFEAFFMVQKEILNEMLTRVNGSTWTWAKNGSVLTPILNGKMDQK